MSVTDAQLDELARELIDRGKLVEAGFVAMRLHAMSPDTPPDQVREMRLAFMAGAQHVFASVMAMLDPGDEPSEADLRRINLIDAELRSIAADLKVWVDHRGSTA